MNYVKKNLGQVPNRHGKYTPIHNNNVNSIDLNCLLTTLPQLNGNINAIVEISKNSSRQVISTENSAENIIKRMRPNSGSKNNPTCTVPAEHSVTKHAADDNCNRPTRKQFN